MLWAVSSPACRPGSVASGGGSKWTLSFSADSAVEHQNFSCPDSFPCWQEMGALLKWCLHGVEAESCLKLLYHESSDWGMVGTKRLERATYLAEEDSDDVGRWEAGTEDKEDWHLWHTVPCVLNRKPNLFLCITFSYKNILWSSGETKQNISVSTHCHLMKAKYVTLD